MFDRIKIGRVGRPILEHFDFVLFELLLYLLRSIYKGVILHKIVIIAILTKLFEDKANLGIENLEVVFGRVLMLLRLKISIYNIKTASPEVPKGCPNHNLHILLCVISLYHLPMPFLCRGSKTLLVVLAPPPLYTTLITPHDENPIFGEPVSLFKAPSKPLSRVLFRKKRSPLSFLVRDTMLRQNRSNNIPFTKQPTRLYNLLVSILRV